MEHRPAQVVLIEGHLQEEQLRCKETFDIHQQPFLSRETQGKNVVYVANLFIVTQYDGNATIEPASHSGPLLRLHRCGGRFQASGGGGGQQTARILRKNFHALERRCRLRTTPHTDGVCITHR